MAPDEHIRRGPSSGIVGKDRVSEKMMLAFIIKGISQNCFLLQY